MIDRERLEHFPSFGCKHQNDTSSVGAVLPADQQASFFTSIAKFHDSVVAKAKALGRISDSRNYFRGRPGDLKQELMLLRLQANLLRRHLTEMKKRAELVPKLGERLKSRGFSFLSHHPEVYRITIHLDGRDNMA